MLNNPHEILLLSRAAPGAAKQLRGAQQILDHTNTQLQTACVKEQARQKNAHLFDQLLNILRSQSPNFLNCCGLGVLLDVQGYTFARDVTLYTKP